MWHHCMHVHVYVVAMRVLVAQSLLFGISLPKRYTVVWTHINYALIVHMFKTVSCKIVYCGIDQFSKIIKIVI